MYFKQLFLHLRKYTPFSVKSLPIALKIMNNQPSEIGRMQKIDK